MKILTNSKLNLAYIAIGCNLSSDHNSLMVHYMRIVNEFAKFITAKSETFRTPAFPKGNGPDFLNGVIAIETELSAQDLMLDLHRIEAKFKRERSERWAARTCDLDLLFYNDDIIPNLDTWKSYATLSDADAQAAPPKELIVPHPRLHLRAFVLGPLKDIAADLVHPALGLPISALWESLTKDERDEISRIDLSSNP